MLEKLFKLKAHGTTVKREILAGVTTFLTMAYILAVNPNILGTVMNANGVFVATAIASAIATFIMAFLANYPIGLSAGLGLNAYFAYTVCLSELAAEENAFTIALTAVFVEGLLFIILSFFKFREQIINSIPQNLKFGISAGIGLFIAAFFSVGIGQKLVCSGLGLIVFAIGMAICFLTILAYVALVRLIVHIIKKSASKRQNKE